MDRRGQSCAFTREFRQGGYIIRHTISSAGQQPARRFYSNDHQLTDSRVLFDLRPGESHARLTDHTRAEGSPIIVQESPIISGL